jgi:prepilin-type N-terminal cleavage/methylation domain-containing protein
MKQGFTLSELLISLSVLGLISALTLPSVFTSVRKQQDTARFKEAFTVLSTVGYEGKLQGDITSTATFINYLRAKMNSAVVCEMGTNVTSRSCNINNRADRTNWFRITLTNGVTIAVDGTTPTVNLTSIALYLNANSDPSPATGQAWIGYNFTDSNFTSTNAFGEGVRMFKSGETAPFESEKADFIKAAGL